MSAQDIEDLIKAFTAATVSCRSAGFDAVEIQTSSDCLLGSVLNPLFNRRTDDYSGSLENRMRPIPLGAAAIGDCLAPRGFWAATDDAMRLVDAL